MTTTTNTTSTIKSAAEVTVGDVIVYRPDPTALTINVLPTAYRRVEKIEALASKWGSGTLLRFDYMPPGSCGDCDRFDADELVEVTTEVAESCTIAPDGHRIR